METKWNQVFVGHNNVTSDIQSTIKAESSENLKIEDTDFNLKSQYVEDNDECEPDSPMYLPQYEKGRSLKSSRVEKRYKYNPKPLGKKNSRSFVSESHKTEDYWQKRIKNNIAARKSREDRRRKEIEVLGRRKQYEMENLQLRLFIEKVENENNFLLHDINLRESNAYPKF